MRTLLCSLFLALLGSTSASAAQLTFQGTISQQNPPAALNGRCAPAARTVTFGPAIAPVAGTSNVGDFVPSGSHCIDPLSGTYLDGQFSFDFGLGDILNGTYSGMLSPTANPMQFSNAQNFSVVGGLGRFLGASGAFTGTGLVTFAPGSLPSSVESFSGSITTSAVPEPAAWTSMLIGFSAIGLALRQRKSRQTTSFGVSTAS